MTDDPTTRPESGTNVEALLAEVLAEHAMRGEPSVLASGAAWIWRCVCGFEQGAAARSVALENHRAHVASAQAAALAGMLPVGTVREEWGVQTTTHVERVSPSRKAAEERLATLLHNAYLPGVAEWTAAQQGAALVHRTRTTYPDTVTEWLPVEDGP